MTAIITVIARLLGVSPAVAHAIASMAAIAAILASGWALTEYIKHQGVEQERARVEKDNQDAIHRGIEASRSFDDCVAAHGLWDFRRQRCSSPADSGR